MLRNTLIAILVPLLILAPAAHAAVPNGHFYGNGHTDMVWTYSIIPPYVDGTGTGYLTTNLATFGDAVAFGMPVTSMNLRVLPAAAPNPVHGSFVMSVPAAADPWWAGYPGGVPSGITTGGDITFTLTGYAEHHAYAVTLYGTYTVTGSTGQYAGMVSAGDWSGSTTGGGSSFGPYFDFAILGQFA